MVALAAFLSPRPVAGPNPLDNYWYGDVGQASTAGVVVTADTALKIATVWRCVNLIADSLAGLPLHVYRRLPDGGKERLDDHPLSGLLTRPNEIQTGMEWRAQMQAHQLLRGNGYNRIVPGRGSFAGQVLPLSPDRLEPPWYEDGRRRWPQDGDQLVYRYRDDSGQTVPLLSDEILHLRGMSLNGAIGLSVVRYARESLGRSLATSEYASRFFSQNGTPAGTLKTDQPLNENEARQYAKSWHEARTGLANAHKIAVLGKGLEFQQITIVPEDMQLIESQEFNAYDVCTWFGVPPHMAGLVTKSTSWGSGIEQQQIAWVQTVLSGWAARMEQRIERSLLLERDRRAGVFVEHNFGGLMRGDSRARSAYYKTMREIGAYSINDVLRLETMNAIPEAWADEHMVPLNFRDASKPPPQPAPGPAGGRGAALARAAARRLVARELEVMRKAASRTGTDLEAWRTEVGRFYATFAGYVAESLDVDRRYADVYCKGHADALIEQGAAAMADWPETQVEVLAAIALGETERIAA